jgi:hypothetical protein
VDNLAKLAAECLQAPKATLQLLASSEAAAAHAACLLGIVTHAASNHQVVTLSDDGSTATRVLRDSTDKPKAKRALSTPLPQPKLKALPAPSSVQGAPVAAWRPPTAQAAARKQLLTESREALARRVEEVGSSLLPRTSGLSAKQRLELLAQRVRDKALT